MENITSNESHTHVDGVENSKDYGNMSKNTLTYERKALEGTPFIIHHSETHGWAAGIAEHKLTGWYETEEQVKKLLKGINQQKGIDWDLLTGIIMIIVEKVLEHKKLTDKIENLTENN